MSLGSADKGCRVLGKYSKRLDVKEEFVRGPFYPESTCPLIGQGVVGAINLNYRELAGIILKARLSRARPVRIETTALNQSRTLVTEERLSSCLEESN